jgi:hypothetical protein
MSPLSTPPEVRLVLPREAAKILGCSISCVRSMALAGLFKTWSLGPMSFAYDLEEIKRHKAEKEAGRKLGKVPRPTYQGPQPTSAQQTRPRGFGAKSARPGWPCSSLPPSGIRQG